ncbi:MAG: hypothetical protein HFJ96_04025 [Peptococcaceae bacterium]|jgi:hypothetical protein|nr:hypothetical protein [Peptococcaceae bacterium]
MNEGLGPSSHTKRGGDADEFYGSRNVFISTYNVGRCDINPLQKEIAAQYQWKTAILLAKISKG